MTDARLAALEAVAEAALEWWASVQDGGKITPEMADVRIALNRLDALPAPTPGETVTLAVWRNPVGGVLLSVASTKDDRDAGRSWTRLGTVTLEVTP